MKWSRIGVAALITVLLFLLIYYQPFALREPIAEDSPELAEAPTTFRFGFNVDSFHIEEFIIEPGLVIGDLLLKSGVSYPAIDALVRAAKDSYPLRKLRAGKNGALVLNPITCSVECFIYEPDPFSFVRYHVGDTIGVEVLEHDIERCLEVSSGTITSSLWSAMESTGHSHDLISRMEDALAWSVDFHHLQKHDDFKLIYEELYVNGTPAGVGKLLGAYYRSGNKEYYSIWFEEGEYKGYYDIEGHPMKSAFLKAPVKFSRISSRYSNSRFHPILKKHKGHFGTDYAAPYGTPIVAVADGIVSIAGYASGNGNYVKIRHDKVYETQYLHMQKFAPGIKAGTRVSQNQVIGHVGSTGLATGPHVCFRFWKNGKQVDHLRENLPDPEPMRPEDLPKFELVKSQILPQLQAIPSATRPSP